MSLDLARAEEQPVTRIEQLEALFREAERPADSVQIGLEHEKLLYPLDGARAVPYEGRGGVGALLEQLTRAGYAPFRETPDSPIIALTRDAETVSLEPGGQLELSGSPFRTAREAHEENLRHLADVELATRQLGLRMAALGYRPFDSIPEMPWMPKTRYRAMRSTLPTRGSMALDMMLMTATGQVSLDWTSEEDCARKLTVSARLAPLMVALYANSPIVRGAPSGYLSYRSHVWTDVDPTRCGYRPWMIDGSFRYRSYVEFGLDAPLLFLRRGGEYRQVNLTFRQLLKDGFEGKPALYGDWTDHLSTLFPEVRLKKVMEIRGADSTNRTMTAALPALWRGLLYDRTALGEAEALLPRLSFDEHLAFHATAGREGLRGTLRGRSFAELAAELLGVAARGLRRLGDDDESLLAPLEERARSGRSPAEDVLAEWEQNRDPAALIRRFGV